MPTGARRRHRRAGRGVFKLKKPVWQDPYPQIPGTRPEKRLFEALVRRNIYFIFQGDFSEKDKKNFPFLQQLDYKPDFIVPEYRVIYDPFGDFAHTLPDSIARDRIKTALYHLLDYEFIHPWSTDIEKYGADWMVDQSERIRGPKRAKLEKSELPYVLQGYRLGENLGLGANSTAKGNSARRHQKSLGLRRRTGRGRRRS